MQHLEALLNSLAPVLSNSDFGVFIHIIKGYFGFTGKFSITNLSRWSYGRGGSLRNMERFFALKHDWLLLSVRLFSAFMLDELEHRMGEFVLAFDETVGKKAGHSTYGVGHHYDSKSNGVIRSIAVMGLSLINTQSKRSYPLHSKQLIYQKQPSESTLKDLKKKTSKNKKSVGRPKGSKNKPKDVAYTFKVLEEMINDFLTMLWRFLPILPLRYAVGDGGFGNDTVAQLCRNHDLELISKLHYNANLYFPYEGPYAGKGRPRKYGQQLDYKGIDAKYLVDMRVEEGQMTYYYHLPNMLYDKFKMPLNAVVIRKESINDDKVGWVVLFSTCPNISWDKIVYYYHCRFQIEFNFRDAREYFGLTHFKSIKQTQVENTIGCAFFMVNLSQLLLMKSRKSTKNENMSILDLKAQFRGFKYAFEIINCCDIPPNQILNSKINEIIPWIGAINTP